MDDCGVNSPTRSSCIGVTAQRHHIVYDQKNTTRYPTTFFVLFDGYGGWRMEDGGTGIYILHRIAIRNCLISEGRDCRAVESGLNIDCPHGL